MPRASLGTVTAAFTAVVVISCVVSRPAAALKIGDWEAVCMAPNTITGELQPVKEVYLSRHPYPPWFARTHRMPDGTWQTDYNRLVMLLYKISDDIKKFIFYHECAHARLNNASERVADCEGLRHMRQDMRVTDQLVKDITHTYLLISRIFPTGGPCKDEEPSQTVDAK